LPELLNDSVEKPGAVFHKSRNSVGLVIEIIFASWLDPELAGGSRCEYDNSCRNRRIENESVARKATLWLSCALLE